jgi:hypothetical protein
MQEVLEEAGIEVTPENKRNVDRAIHEIVNVEYKNCPPTWREVKNRILGSSEERNAFIKELRRVMKER